MTAHSPKWRRITKGLVPPLILRLARGGNGLGFLGDFPSWQDAQTACSGYDEPSIMEKVSAATQAVVEGRAVFERDSVLFDRPQYTWPLLAILLKIAAENGNRLQVLDFGGSLGSTYRQCRGFIPRATAIEWSVVEQAAFVARGRERFQTAELRFHAGIAECLAVSKASCLLLSSVLQYLEAPYAFLSEAVGMGFESIVVDRTPFSVSGRDRIVKQVVPPEIYAASYPARLLDKEKLLACFAGKYRVEAEFPTLDGFDDKAEFKGFFLTRT